MKKRMQMKKRMVMMMMMVVVAVAVTAVFAVRIYARDKDAKENGEVAASVATVAAECAFVDEDGNGVCDPAKTCHGDQAACPCNGKGCLQCPDFEDSDGDGACDIRNSCSGHSNGNGRRGCRRAGGWVDAIELLNGKF